MDVQQLAFLYNKEEKDAAILKFRETMNEVPDQSGGTQPILRAARAIVSIVIGVSQENGAYAKLVMDSAKDMLFGPDPQKLETALGDNRKAAVGMIRADHTPGGWTALRFLAACAAPANQDPNSPKGPKGQLAISLRGCPPPPPPPFGLTSRAFWDALPFSATFSAISGLGTVMGLSEDSMAAGQKLRITWEAQSAIGKKPNWLESVQPCAMSLHAISLREQAAIKAASLHPSVSYPSTTRKTALGRKGAAMPVHFLLHPWAESCDLIRGLLPAKVNKAGAVKQVSNNTIRNYIDPTASMTVFFWPVSYS